MSSRRLSRLDLPWPGVMALGLALAVPASLGPATLAKGGLAPLAVTAVVAGFLGIPLARAEWHAGPLDRSVRWNRGATALAELWSILLVGAIAAPLVVGPGWMTALGGAAVALLLWALVVWANPWAGAALALVAAMFAGGSAAAAPTLAVPWTLLEPHWETWREWLPRALTGGLLLAAAGLGQWNGGPPPIPGARRLPWATAGATLVVALAVSIEHATQFEHRAGAASETGIAGFATLAALAAATAVVGRNGSGMVRARRAGGIWLATLWFAGPAWGVLPIWWSTLLPLGLALVAVPIARTQAGAARWSSGLAGVCALAAATAGWPGLPQRPLDAGLMGAMVVMAVWVAGTRVVLEDT